ncbi:MAG: cobalamin-dependent protein [Deltaproteobacteria bacterium]|nr:cobalamin-dependent protein [Deltaproteobacteria bacterium]
MKFLIIIPAWPKLAGQTLFNLPPVGAIQAAACLPSGVAVEVINDNLQEVDLAADADLVGFSVLLTCQAPRAYELARAFRDRGKTVVIGGLHAALCTEECLEHADAVVAGEAEGVLPQVVADFSEGRLQRLYRPAAPPDLALAPLPRRDLYDKKAHYSYKGWEMVDLVETSRGCRFNCYPCCIPSLGLREHRKKPWADVARDLEACQRLIFMVDNSLEQSTAYQKELFTNLVGAGKRWISHPISPEPELLALARRSGCWYVYHAIYTISDKIADRIKLYHDHGIAVEGTILLGLDDHDEDFIKRLIDFLLTLDLDLAEFTVLTPFPGTRCRTQLAKEGRIFDHDWRHYNAGTVVYQPRQMSPEKLQELYHLAWSSFYAERSQNWRMSKLFLDVLKDLPRDESGRRRA